MKKKLTVIRKSADPIYAMKGLKFIDLFAGVGGFRLGFENAGFQCVFSSEWDRFASQAYEVNFGEKPAGDIRKISSDDLPNFDVLTGGFPCQPFSIAGVTKKNALGRKHGFLDETQGTLFFEVARIIRDRSPRAFVLENVKNLVSHDKGRTFQTIINTLTGDLGYHIKYSVLSSRQYVPQNRQRIFIVGFKNASAAERFQFPVEAQQHSEELSALPRIGDILEKKVDIKYTLSDKLWNYLQDYKEKHRAAGHGFGYGLVDLNGQARTLSARYYKDGSEVLLPVEGSNPRRLTPRECARLMGFPDSYQIAVSDTQAYKQFGNAVVVPLVEAVAKSVRIAMTTSGAKGNTPAPQSRIIHEQKIEKNRKRRTITANSKRKEKIA